MTYRLKLYAKGGTETIYEVETEEFEFIVLDDQSGRNAAYMAASATDFYATRDGRVVINEGEGAA